MSVLIKGMEMPTSCDVCPFNVFKICLINTLQEGKYTVTHSCPLVPVPPHGALIDRDDFFATCPELVDGYKRISDDFVVIPAEEGE